MITYDTFKAATSLGRSLEKRIFCKYESRENDCPDNCLNCAFSIKARADELLEEKQIALAIKQYKRALFANPSYADAWVGIAHAFGMNAEYNHALTAYDRAIGIDSGYGYALFGKAVVLRELGRFDEALSIVKSILLLYDNEEVYKLRDSLVAAGATDLDSVCDLDAAIDKLTDMAYGILLEHDLLGPENEVVTERAICKKEEYSAQVMRFCKKRYSSLGKKKFQSESILTAFYSSLCTTLFYYEDNQGFVDVDPFDYIANHIDLEKAENVAEKMLDIRGDKAACEALWDLIYGYVQDALSVFEMVKLETNVELAVLDATENAYMMGMMYAMKRYADKKKRAERTDLDAALDKLAASSNEYDYTPEVRNAMCYSIDTPKNVQIAISCPECGRQEMISVWEGEEQLVSKYQTVALLFAELGYPATVACYCNDCANMIHPTRYLTSNIVFSIEVAPNHIVRSFPSSRCFRDFDYRVALAFLRGADTIEKLAKATSTRFSAETYLKKIHDVLGEGRHLK